MTGSVSRPLLASPWFEVERMPGRLLRVVRTDRSFESAEELDRAHLELFEVLERLPRDQLGVLVDLRQAPARNDPEFERLMRAHRPRIFAEFARRAVLVKTAVGKLHVQRHARADGYADLVVFTDEPSAMSYASRGE